MKALSGMIICCIVAACVALGCTPAEKPPAEPQAKGRLFGVVFQTMNNPFFVDLNNGMKDVVEAHGDTLITLDSQFNSLKQKNDISDLLLKGVAAVFINPVNWEGIKGSLIQAREKGVPCIVVDAPVKDADLVLCQVASDNAEAGRLAARALAQVRRPANIVILHRSVNKACIDRVAGFTEEIAKYPDMKILDTQEGQGTAEGARPVMRDLLGRFPGDQRRVSHQRSERVGRGERARVGGKVGRRDHRDGGRVGGSGGGHQGGEALFDVGAVPVRDG